MPGMAIDQPDDFQPGDGTRYVIDAVTYPGGSGPLGHTIRGFAVIYVINIPLVFHVNLDNDFVSFHALYDQNQRNKVNPWTIRAALLWLQSKAEEMGWNVMVDLEGAPQR